LRDRTIGWKSDLQMVQFLALPFLVCLVLTGMHVYFGVQMVRRREMFFDLALAQIAALGTAAAYLAGYDVRSPITYFFSLTFTIVGAGLFALTRVRRERRIPQEAIIGIVFAVSAAAATLAMSKAPEGTEHLRDILAGNIIAVSQGTLIKTAVLYALVGLVHYIFRKRVDRKLSEFLFYTTFAVVVASSVAIAGVLLVFAYLIVPPVAAMLFSQSTVRQLAIGWTMGALVSAVGLVLSLKVDLPASATIVCTLGLALAVMAGVRLAR
jgi:zinc/manganese transport system permease protein